MLTDTARSFRSEWILLNHRRLWAILLATTAVLSVAATWLVMSTSGAQGSGPPGTVSAAQMNTPGGATAAVAAATGYAALLVVAGFAALTGNEITRGITRFSLTRQPDRLALITGRLSARVAVAGAAGVVALLSGAAAAALLASRYDVSRAQWLSADGLVESGLDAARLALFVVTYAAIGTTAAVLIRSTPLALGALLLWFGPVENVLGAGNSWAQRWFPGLVLRSLMNPDAPGALPTATAAATVCGYLVICAVVVSVTVTRRDVTS